MPSKYVVNNYKTIILIIKVGTYTINTRPNYKISSIFVVFLFFCKKPSTVVVHMRHNIL